MLVRNDGLVIRNLNGDQYKSFFMNGNFYQFYGSGSVDTINLLGHTAYEDQFTLMPKSIFDRWNKK